MTGLLWLVAPFIARFYEQDLLIPILRWLSLSVSIGALGTVHAAKMRRDMQFKRLFWVTFPSVLGAGTLGVTLALMGYGVWALVAQALVMQVLRSTVLWIQSGWRPLWIFDLERLKQMMPFGSRLAAVGIIDRTFQNIYVMVIGKIFMPADVGYFQRAKSFQQLPVDSLQMILGRVAFPLFSQIQDDPARLKKGLSKAIQISALISFTMMAGIAAVAEPMVITLIGEKWRSSIVLLQWLCIAGALFPIQAMNLSLLMAMGESKLFLRLEIIKKVIVLINIAITYRYGLLPMIYGMVCVAVLSFILNTYYTNKFVGYSFTQQLRDVFPTGVLSLIMFTISCGVIAWTDLAPALELILGITVGMMVLICGIRCLNHQVREELKIIIERLPERCHILVRLV